MRSIHGTVVIGLDGATFEVIRPLIGDGLMPNLERFLGEGAWGLLQSTIPPVSAPAWLSLATGLSPATTGVFDFRWGPDENYRLRPVTSENYRGKAIWDYLSSANRTVCILNYPLLYPPYRVNGLMVSGIGSPDKAEYTSPPELKATIESIAGGPYQRHVAYRHRKYKDEGLLLRDVGRQFEMQLGVCEYLLRQRSWDLFWVVFSAIDWIQHVMWKHIDESHPLHDPEISPEKAAGFRAFWTKVDQAIGRLQAIAGPERNLIVLSDHGFGKSDQVFRLNSWLEREGFLTTRSRAAITAQGAVSSLRRMIREAMRLLGLYSWVSRLYRQRTSGVRRFQFDPIDTIDLARSVAFDPGHTLPVGAIYMNDRVLQSAEARQEKAREISHRLHEYGDSRGLEIKTYRPHRNHQHLTEGKRPDLLVEVGSWRCGFVKDISGDELFTPRPYSAQLTGSHRPEGVLMAVGPDIAKVELGDASVWDLAPTLMYLLGEAIPRHMEGRVLSEAIRSFPAGERPRRSDGPMGDIGAAQQERMDYTEEEEEQLLRRLRDLGYL